jgi:uncharacterized membrane protein YagU involved in acid resistance
MARHKPGKGAAAGLVGGLVGTVVMTEFQEAWSKASKALKRDGQQSQQQPSAEQSEDATMRAAGKIAVLGGRQLSHAEKAKFAPLVHYSFGTLSGAAYGLAMEKAGVKGGFIPGLIFGAALFALADEIAVPALKLSGKASETPLSGHISAFAAHLVYGVSTELARRGLRAAI